MARRKSKPTTRARSEKQNTKDRLAHAVDDARRLGIIEMRPEEALGPERVDPRTQNEQQLPQLVKQALKNNWSVPDEAKPRIVGALLEPFFANDVVMDSEGNQIKVPPDRNLLKENAKVLGQLDQRQYERDHPEEAGKAKGGVKVETTVAVGVTYQEAYKAAMAGAMTDEVEDEIEQGSQPRTKEVEGSIEPAN